jgi:hypothetical protein
MKHNHGQEIVLNRVRLTTQNVLARVSLCLCLTFAMSALAYVLLAPPLAIRNVIGYGGSHLLVTIKRQAPSLLHMHPEDLAHDRYYGAQLDAQQTFWHRLGTGASSFAALSFIVLTYIFRKKGKAEEADEFKRGSRLVSAKEHNRLMRSAYGAKSPLEMGQEIELGKEKLLVPEALSYRHFSFVGASGYGKSTTIEELMAQVRAHGHKALVLEIKGAYYAKFGRPGDRILSLYDQRSEAWDFWHEPLATPDKIAAAMIEETGGQNKFFWKGARALLASLLRLNQDLAGLWQDFNRPVAEIRAKLSDHGELSRRVVGDHDSEQGDGIVGTTVLDFAFLRDLGYWAKGKVPFSVTTWMNDNADRSWVFLVVNEADLEVAGPLLRVWFDLAVLAALERDEMDKTNVHTWLVIDELKTVGKLPSLPHILDKGRKYRTSVVVGYQATTQLRAIYGDDEAENIMHGLQNKFFYRMASAKAADEASQSLGEEEVIQAVDGVSFGIDSTSDRGTISRQHAKKRLVLPDALYNQEQLRCFVKLCHHMPTEARFHVASRPRLNVPSMSRYPPPDHRPQPAPKVGPTDEQDVEGPSVKKKNPSADVPAGERKGAGHGGTPTTPAPVKPATPDPSPEAAGLKGPLAIFNPTPEVP